MTEPDADTEVRIGGASSRVSCVRSALCGAWPDRPDSPIVFAVLQRIEGPSRLRRHFLLLAQLGPQVGHGFRANARRRNCVSLDGKPRPSGLFSMTYRRIW